MGRARQHLHQTVLVGQAVTAVGLDRPVDRVPFVPRTVLDYRVTAEREVRVQNFAAESDRIYSTTGPSGHRLREGCRQLLKDSS